ncbi:MAG: erythromycin esterase family protein [Candidatus Alcyoniella australis]|nr:erythromycin esterase family protein [Candidatus Alcyoniella australis]
MALSALLVGTLCCCAISHAHQEDLIYTNALELGSLKQGLLGNDVVRELADAAAGKRFIALGEGDHFVAEKYGYRLAFLRTLVIDQGVRLIAMEIGGSDARRIDEFLRTGDEGWLNQVVLYGFRGNTDSERRELSPFPPVPPASCEERFITAERSFWKDVHELSEEARSIDGRRIELYGFDFDAKPGGGYRDARDALAQCSADPFVDQLRAALTPPSGSGGRAEIARIRTLAQDFSAARDRLDTSCGDDAAGIVARDLQLLALSYEIAIDWSAAGNDLDAQRARFVRREALMFERMSLLAQLRPGERIVLLGHNLHLCRSSTSLRFGPDGHDRPMWSSVVTELEQSMPGSTYIVWLLYGEGSRLYPTPEDGCDSLVRLRKGSLEAMLSQQGEQFFLPLRSVPRGTWIDRKIGFGTPTSYASGPLRDVVDAIVFSRSAEASR